MRGNYLPRLGDCIETPHGGGRVSYIRPLETGDFEITVVHFTEHELERIRMSDWNDYENWRLREEGLLSCQRTVPWNGDDGDELTT